MFSNEKPPKAFIETITNKDDLTKISYISDLNSDSFCDPENPREFFAALANSTQSAAMSEQEITTPEEIVKHLSDWDANKFTFVQHESEWHDKAESKSIFDTLLQMFKERDLELPFKLDHEKQRVNKLVWMQDVADLGIGKHVWSWLPVQKVELCIPLKKAKEIALQVSGGYEGTNPSYNSLAGNFDGAGMSWGIIQFNFGQNTLGPLLIKMREKIALFLILASLIQVI